MKKPIKTILLGLGVLLLSGCVTTDMSMRESRGYNVSNYLYGLYGSTEGESEITVIRPKPPIKVALVQMGEQAPSENILLALKKETTLFKSVESLPAAITTTQSYREDKSKQVISEKELMDKMCQLGRAIDVDYLFIYGGTIDIAHTTNPLSFFDITLVGAFVVPHNLFTSTGKASGALIDVKNKTLVFTVTSHVEQKNRLTSVEANYSSDRILGEMIKKMNEGLAEAFVEKLQAYL